MTKKEDYKASTGARSREQGMASGNSSDGPPSGWDNLAESSDTSEEEREEDLTFNYDGMGEIKAEWDLYEVEEEPGGTEEEELALLGPSDQEPKEEAGGTDSVPTEPGGTDEEGLALLGPSDQDPKVEARGTDSVPTEPRGSEEGTGGLPGNKPATDPPIGGRGPKKEDDGTDGGEAECPHCKRVIKHRRNLTAHIHIQHGERLSTGAKEFKPRPTRTAPPGPGETPPSVHGQVQQIEEERPVQDATGPTQGTQTPLEDFHRIMTWGLEGVGPIRLNIGRREAHLSQWQSWMEDETKTGTDGPDSSIGSIEEQQPDSSIEEIQPDKTPTHQAPRTKPAPLDMTSP